MTGAEAPPGEPRKSREGLAEDAGAELLPDSESKPAQKRTPVPEESETGVFCFKTIRLLHPLGVEELANRLVDALIGVSSEEVALRLQQVRRQPRRAVAVVIGQ